VPAGAGNGSAVHRLLAQSPQGELAIVGFEAFEHEHAVEMVDLVEQEPTEELVADDGHIVAVEIEARDRDHLRAHDVEGETRQREAALFVEPFVFGVDDRGVDERVRALTDVVHEETPLHPDLRCGEPDAGGLVHGGVHGVDQLGERAVELRDGRSGALEHRIAEESDRVRGHSPIVPATMDTMFHRRRGLADDWEAVVSEHLGIWRTFDSSERDRLAGIADWLLRHKHWEAARGFELDDIVPTIIAVQAGILVLALDIGFYREVSAIVVFPTTIFSHGPHAGPVPGTLSDDVVPLLGQAQDRHGAILVAWDDAHRAARHPGHGRNVVFHEFAHKIDMLDNLIDGTPPLDTKEQLARWVAVCTEPYAELRAGTPRPPLDPYGGESPAEFFAVATETFFDTPLALEANEPALFDVLRDFYLQDPAERARRPHH
jgi:Mlc titration factor MtfA (ptsG expression regulator)